MQTFKSLIPFLLTAGLAVNAETTSCVTSTKTFPTITSIIVEPTSTWSGNGTGSGPHTVYTTEYHEFCSTGLRLHTYTITEACHKEKCQPRTTGVPPGFTSTVTVCNSCGEKPITATLTVPCPEATPTKGPWKPQPEHCETCHDQGEPSGKPPVQPQPVPSAPAVKPVPTGHQPEECTSCGPKPPSASLPQPLKPTNNPGEEKTEHPNPPAACTTCGAGGEVPHPPASLATSVVPGPSGEKPATSPTGPAPGEPSAITAGAAKSSYVELGLLGIVGFGLILLGGPL
ncbi:hypothetical protein FPRO03_02851 [Fusarium proliferatum]|uniref:Uncharacterized protein n=1 Tax=Gibberella intermedia TaxID=948311 RepID=A0A365N3Z6_GIBIN|nr:hypothetical protein FPRO03_02851 [Fusarium proliferatum]RBA15507.1 hypothetical protein FPRO05_12581 [Fusarium proliferatum]